MTANDPGHVNNLDRNQTAALKAFWIRLIDCIRGSENILDSVYEDELYLAIGYDNPDTLLLRWLRARKWDVNNALQQFIDTLRWRHEWGVKEFIAKGESELHHEEIITGKTCFLGLDKVGRPINYASVRDHIKGQFPPEATEKLTVYIMETGRKLVEPPIEAVTVIFDMTDFSLSNMDYQHVKFIINLLQNHYPESFGLGLIINSPWIFNGCWYIIKPWLDPVVEKKIRFVKNLDELSEFIDPSNLPKRLNGTQPDFSYIPPTDEDLAMITAFRNDHRGKLKAQEAHREAGKNFVRITLQWARQDETDSLIEERTIVTKKLKDAFEQLVPYISTRTHYHRTGVINEPIFDIAYKRIQNNAEE